MSPSKIWDVIVVGAGPAGGIAARKLVSAGREVLVIERYGFPRYKPCAGGLTARAMDLLDLPPDDYQENAICRGRVIYGELPDIKIDYGKTIMVTSRREVLDACLIRTAVDAGAIFQSGEPVRKVAVGDEYITIETTRRTYRCRYLIGADGANGVTRTLLQSSRERRFLPSIEIEAELPEKSLEKIKDEIWIDIGVARRGYGWCFPKMRTVAVGIAGDFKSRQDIETRLDGLLQRVPGFDQARIVHRNAHPVPLYQPDFEFARGRLLLTGDAAGLVDPFLGEGIFYALYSGMTAAKWILKDGEVPSSAQEYTAMVREGIHRELLLANRMASWIYRFPGIFHRIALRKPDILYQFGLALTETDSYALLCSKLGIPYRWMFMGI